MHSPDFSTCFHALTGHAPFPWQSALFKKFLRNDIPRTCDLPTGLGKTSTIAIWVLALADHAQTGNASKIARRLVYVVNRRTVVDQATREVERIREALLREHRLQPIREALQGLTAGPAEVPLAISTLRGEFADNTEWRTDPARPAVVVGTVDMVGSRLLFSGYGCGFKTRPLHAGFLGQDALVIHDEAHLEPAFQTLLQTIEGEQERSGDIRPIRVMALTATSRADDAQPFGLTDADRKHKVVDARIRARKRLALHAVEDEKKLSDRVAEAALAHKESGAAVLVFLRRLEDVQRVAESLRKDRLMVQVLTGTQRGRERDTLARSDPVFARFRPDPEVAPAQGTVFLCCTSAGEVGINISADHFVSDLSAFDSMAQRLGRVNRFGEGDASVDVVFPARLAAPDSDDELSAMDRALARTLQLLTKLPARPDGRHDASPNALGKLPAAERIAAFTPAPVVLQATDILFDAWALTTVRERLSGRPAIADFLHGVAPWEPPETHVAWREEVERIAGGLLGTYPPEDLLADYPLKPHELLRDRTDRVLRHLEAIAERRGSAPAWVLAADGTVRVTTLAQLVETDTSDLQGSTVLLPPNAGGLALANGVLDGSAEFDESQRGLYDVADEWKVAGEIARRRVWDDEGRPPGMRLVRGIDTRPDVEEEGDEAGEGEGDGMRRRFWRWYVRPRRAEDDGSRTAEEPQELAPHLRLAESFARALAARLGLGALEAQAVSLAARWHDLGKSRAIWQRSIGNRDPARVLAKSGGRMQPAKLNRFRHELGSMLDVTSEADFARLDALGQDLVLHLIAAHHGRARPHFPAEEVFDPERSDVEAIALAREVPRRFARLQRRYGRWGLAYLESLVRAADVLASQPAREPVAASQAGSVLTGAAP